MQTNRIGHQPSFQARTFLMIKPDAVKKGVEAKILEKVLNVKGLSITKLKMDVMDLKTAKKHYEEHEGKKFFGELIDFITSGPVVKVEVEGKNAVKKVRGLSDSIRKDFGTDKTQNAVHTSDSKVAAKRELGLHFDSEAKKSFFSRLNIFNK